MPAEYPDKPSLNTTARMPVGDGPRAETPIVPRGSISGSALIAVVAIMTFLAALTTGAVVLIAGAASEWQSDVAREVTIQIRPGAGRDMESEVGKAVQLARAVPGIADIRPYSREESARLLEPWLGSGLVLEDLPVPRLIVVKIAAGEAPDLVTLRKALTERVSGASLDDHRGWVARMQVMGRSAVGVGIAVLLLVLAATVLSVSFATRGAMATNQAVVEVLHFIGARDDYIAAQFQRHFLVLGLKGGVIGGGVALLVFAVAGLIGDFFLGTATADQVTALFGSFSIGRLGYCLVIAQIILVATVTTWTSRRVVKQTLAAVE
jgi:cell division transport system permease protein